MEWILLGLFILVIILFLPIEFDWRFIFNIFENTGEIELDIFKIKMLGGKLKMQNGEIILLRESRFQKKEEIELNSEKIVYAFNIGKRMAEKVDVKSISLSAEVSHEDPMLACLTKTAIEILFLQILSILITTKNTSVAKNNCTVEFGNKKLVFAIKTTFYISLWNILITFLISRFKALKQKKLKEKKGEAK
ncbi:MAG: hypothetical protein WCR30_02215 [Clostridia bacterium]